VISGIAATIDGLSIMCLSDARFKNKSGSVRALKGKKLHDIGRAVPKFLGRPKLQFGRK